MNSVLVEHSDFLEVIITMKGWHCINKEHTSGRHATSSLTLHQSKERTASFRPSCPLLFWSKLEPVVSTGAAFSANLTGGISTSVAVFCHELPHELGKWITQRMCGEEKKKKTKSLTHYTIDTAQFLYSTRWSKLSVEDSAVSSHDNQCLNHCLMQNSTFSYLSWNF